MQLKVIESFIVLYQEQNISKASLKLYISQQGLSRQIQSLEKELDVVLFKRSNTGVEPTSASKMLYPYFEDIYKKYMQAASALEDYKKHMNKRCLVAFAYGVTNSVSSDFMFEYQKKHPDVNLEIEEWSQATCIQKLTKNELNAAFLISPVDETLINSTPLIEGKMIIAVHKSHPLAISDEPIEFGLLDGENLITGVKENAVRGVMDYFCDKTGVSFKILISSSNNLNFINSMTENLGIAPITQTIAERVTNPEIFLRRVITPGRAYLCYCTPKNAENSKGLADIQRYVLNYFKTTPVEELLRPGSSRSTSDYTAAVSR